MFGSGTSNLFPALGVHPPPVCSISMCRLANAAKDLATYLLGEAFERLRTRGVLLVEAQTMQHNAPASRYTKSSDSEK